MGEDSLTRDLISDFQVRLILPTKIYLMSRDISDCHNSGIQQAEARNATNHPTMHRVVPQSCNPPLRVSVMQGQELDLSHLIRMASLSFVWVCLL